MKWALGKNDIWIRKKDVFFVLVISCIKVHAYTPLDIIKIFAASYQYLYFS